MQHIDQKVLELYVLNDNAVVQQREAIEQHLDECAGCRELVARMEDMYAGFFETMENEPLQTSSQLPVRQKKSLTTTSPSPLQEIRANYEIERAPIRRVMLFARRHPVVSSTMSLFVLGFFALLSWQVFNGIESFDENPSYYFLNDANAKFEVYNKTNQMLWSMPLSNIKEVQKFENDFKMKKAIISDINGDGINEIITNLQFNANLNGPRKILVFDNKGTIIKSFAFQNKNIQFKNIFYNMEFYAGTILKIETFNNELAIITDGSAGRSPCFVARLDSHLNVVGRYWHFGSLMPFISDIDNNGNNEIVALGKNDVEDNIMRDYPVMVVLDPKKLITDQEASAARGYGLKQSESEVYYIRFPESDMEKATQTKLMARSIVYDDTNYIHVHVENLGDV
ncbi:MAG: hypothetical protein AB1728_09415, partial [Bacteroidota bacterium]